MKPMIHPKSAAVIRKQQAIKDLSHQWFAAISVKDRAALDEQLGSSQDELNDLF